jgi:hypothetical protein
MFLTPLGGTRSLYGPAQEHEERVRHQRFSGKKKVAQDLEAGADNFITNPISVNMLIEKIASTLVPQDVIGKMVRRAKSRIRSSVWLPREILEKKQGSPAGLLYPFQSGHGVCGRETYELRIGPVRTSDSS